MTVRLGFIGTGDLGADHVRRCANILSGATVSALYNRTQSKAQTVAEQFAPEALVTATPEELIESPDVEAIVISSASQTHEDLVLKAIEAGKYVFCEKPLATTADGCERILHAESAAAKRLVQVGFMRPYDEGYQNLKSLLTDDAAGRVLMAHAAHRNPFSGPHYTREMLISETLIHDINTFHWLLGESFKTVQVFYPRPTSRADAALRDPQLVLLETSSGVLITVEVFVNCQFGYDVQCALIGENGEVRLPEPVRAALRKNGQTSVAIPMDCKERFATAYDRELQAFVDGVAAGKLSGPDSWAGYVASATADACIRAQKSGQKEAVQLITQPEFYRHDTAV
ncbi:Gfo/Idh/MocA family protein [Acetobacter persici]|uniref:Gfo/Idh/MocA family protein n=1 Tax=Acetobacter persici TaxID=1076596 RepID=UPI0039ED45B0